MKVTTEGEVCLACGQIHPVGNDYSWRCPEIKEGIDEGVGKSYPGFVAEFDGKLIASAKTINEVLEKENVKQLRGNKRLLIRHVSQEGVFEIYPA